MNIDDYMDMLAYEAEQEVDSFEAEIDFLHKELDVLTKALKMACRELGYAYADKGRSTTFWTNYFLQKAREDNDS